MAMDPNSTLDKNNPVSGHPPILLTEDNFVAAPADLLLEAKRYREIEDMIISIDAAYTPDYARAYAISLAAKLEAVWDRIPQELLGKYLRLIKALHLFGLLSVADKEKEKFFHEQILDVFRLDFVNVKDWVELLFKVFHENRDIVEGLRRLIIRGLQANVEALGANNLHIVGAESPQKPTLQNWLADYNRSTPPGPARTGRGRLEQMNYMAKSPHAVKLDQENKRILSEALALYDFVRYSKFEYDFSFPGQKPLVDQEIEPGKTAHELIPAYLVDLLKTVHEGRSDEATGRPPEFIRKEKVVLKDLKAPRTGAPSAPKPVRRTLPPPPPPPQRPAPVSQQPVQSRPIPRIVEQPKPRVQIPDISTELSVAEPRVQQPQSTPSLTKPTFTASPFRQSPPAAQTPVKTAPVVRPEPKPQQRPDLIKPAVGLQQPTGAGQTPTTAYKLPTTPPAAPHPTAADRSQISVAPKFAGAPKDMVKPQITQEPKNVRTEQQTPSQIPTTSPTLEALRRIRAEEEKQKQRIQSGQGAEPQIVPLGGMSDFSVNDALIHAGKGGRFGSGVSQGGAVAEGEPSGVADRLRKLEGKTTQEPKNARTEEPGAGKAPPTPARLALMPVKAGGFPPPPGTP